MNILHAFEQMQSTLRYIAPVLWSYKQHLVEQGFTEEQAFESVRDYQNNVLKPQQ